MSLHRKQSSLDGHSGRTRGRRRGLAALGAGLCAIALVACDPGAVSNLVGDGTSGNTGDGGPAVDAKMITPASIALAPDGSYYVVDTTACVIRRVDSNKQITTVAGTGTCGFSGDGGPATSAMIDPTEPGHATSEGWITVLSDGTLVLADTGNGRLRVVTSSGTIVTLFTASGACSGVGDELVGLGGVAFANGKLYLACGSAGLFSVSLGGALTPVPGTVIPTAMAVSANGDLFVLGLEGSGDATIQGVAGDGSVMPVASVPPNYPGDVPTALAVGTAGELYMVFNQTDGASYGSGVIMRVNADGSSMAVAGNGSPDPGTVLTGHGIDVGISPAAIVVTASGSMIFSSGHNVYRLEAPKDVVAPTTTIAAG